MKHRDPFASWFGEKQNLLADDKDLPRLPVTEISDADPPAFLKDGRLVDLHRGNDPVDKLDDRIDVESWLGCYNTNENRITIWRRGVELSSRRIRCEYKDLLDLVLAHEFGHWFHDKAETPNGVSWDRAALVNATKEYNEAWAQWFTWLYAKEHDARLCTVFEDLEKRQSEPYRIWSEIFGRGNVSVADQKARLRALSYMRSEARGAPGRLLLNRKGLQDAITLCNLDPDTKHAWEKILPHL